MFPLLYRNLSMPNRQIQPEANILLILRRWLRKTLATIADPRRWTESFIVRVLVVGTLLLWLIILILNFFLVYEQEVPPLPVLPLYAFFPGEILSGQVNSHPALLHAWGIGSGMVFFALALAAVRYKKKSAGFAFLALFLISTLIVYGRIVDQLRHLQ
ncbi:MAG TPA: hypothetical protein VMJ12_02590 [Candidatus Acidoferrales bacterium]|nr:hypothetical protein [Candidatus Acidoferrales bacterium]